jgi:hypothetical protein
VTKKDIKNLVDLGLYREVYAQIREPYYLLDAGEPSRSEQGRYLTGTALGYVLPFGSRLVGKFKTKEYFVTHLQMRDPEIRDIFIQIPILRTPHVHATIFSIAAIVKRPIPETIIGINDFLKFIPYSPLKKYKKISVRKVFKQRINWSSLLYALNNDKDLKTNISYLPSLEYADSLKSKIIKSDLPGYVRLFPYKGWTIIELTVAPVHEESDDPSEESFSIERCMGVFRGLLNHIKQYGVKRGEIGIIPLGPGNQHSILNAIKRVDELSSGKPLRRTRPKEIMKDFEIKKLKKFEEKIGLMDKKISRNKNIYTSLFVISIITIISILINSITNLLESVFVCLILLSSLGITLSLVLGVYLLAVNSEIKKKKTKDLPIISYLKESTGL